MFIGINERIDRAIREHEETGAAFILTIDGAQVHYYEAGIADAEKGLRFGLDTICRVFSCTKIVTSMAAMQLIERGMLDTNWQLDRFFPEYAEPYYIRKGRRHKSPPIRIRDLLNMTSGIPYPGDAHEGIEGMNALWGKLDQSIRDGHSMTTAEFAAEAGKQPLMFAAGKEWMYGSSADIMGAVIEKIADMRLSEYMAKNIFEPLGMADTAFYVPKSKQDRLAVLYETAGEKPKKPDYVNLCIYDYDKLPAFESGGAGLFSTALDYSKLGTELAGGGEGVISRRAVSFMRENGLTVGQRKTYNWEQVRGCGYGNFVRSVESRNLAGTLAGKGMFGWDGWTGTYQFCDPEERLSVTLFLQRCGAGTTQLAKDLVNIIYASL